MATDWAGMCVFLGMLVLVAQGRAAVEEEGKEEGGGGDKECEEEEALPEEDELFKGDYAPEEVLEALRGDPWW